MTTSITHAARLGVAAFALLGVAACGSELSAAEELGEAYVAASNKDDVPAKKKLMCEAVAKHVGSAEGDPGRLELVHAIVDGDLGMLTVRHTSDGMTAENSVQIRKEGDQWRICPV